MSTTGPLKPSKTAYPERSRSGLPLDKLRRRFARDAYLYLKRLLPRDGILRARKKYFEFVSPSGVLKRGRAPVDGIFESAKDAKKFPEIGVGRVDANVVPDKQGTDFVSLAIEAHGQKWYAVDLCKHPVMLGCMTRFTGWSNATQPLERTLLRKETSPVPRPSGCITIGYSSGTESPPVSL